MDTLFGTEFRVGSPRPAARSLPDRLLGLLGWGMILAALVFLLVGGEGDGAAAETPAVVPALELVAPSGGSLPGGAGLAVEFRVAEELQQRAGGWGVGDLHLHLELNGMQFMPSPSDIQRLPSGAYRWSLAPPGPGEHSIRLFWSDPDHRPLAEGASEAVRITVRNR